MSAPAGQHNNAGVSRPTKLPLIAPFDSGPSIEAALNSPDQSLIAAALVQIERDARELEQKALAGSLPKPPLVAYLDSNPRADGIFQAWDTAHKSNNSQLSAAVLSALAAVIRLISSAPHPAEPQLIRRLLSDYGSHLDRALNPGRNDVTTAALRLACVLVAFAGGRFARRLFGCFSWSTKLTSRLYKTRLNADKSRDPLARPDIRTLLVMLVLSFLAVGDAKLKQELVETKGLLAGIFKGISEDAEVVVQQVLASVYTDLIADRSVPLETRRSVCEESSILELAKLYSHPAGQTMRSTVSRFLYALAEWLATQVNHNPLRSFGPQKALLTVLRSLNLTEDSEQRLLGLHILRRAPVIGGQFWAKFPASLDPRLSSRWISAITFAIEVVSLPVSPQLTVSAEQQGQVATPPSARSVLDNILPPSLNELWYTKAVRHENALVSFLSSLFLLAALQKAAAVLDAVARSSARLEEEPGTGRWAQLALAVRNNLAQILPDPQTIIALMQKTAPEPEQALRTNVALRLLFGYHRVSPGLIAAVRFDFGKLPQAHLTPTGAEGIRAISSAYALRLAAIHSSRARSSKPSEHFKSNIAPLFQLLKTESTAANRTLLLANLSALLDSAALFGQENSPELAIWVNALEGQPHSAISFFEATVHQALTAKMTAAAQDDKDALSPLLSAFLAQLEADAKADPNNATGLAAFVHAVVLGFCGRSSSTKVPKKIIEAVKSAWEELKPAADTLKFLKEIVKALTKPTEASFKAGKGDLRSPVSQNIFAQEADDLEAVLAAMAPELVALHLTPAALAASATCQAIVDRLASRAESTGAAQVLVHRLVNVGWAEDEMMAVVDLLGAVYGSAERAQADKAALVGKGSTLLTAFEHDKLPPQVAAAVIDALLSSKVTADVALAQPYCELVTADLTAADGRKAIPERVLHSAALVKFFAPGASAIFADAVLGKISAKKAHKLDKGALALVAAALNGAAGALEQGSGSQLLDKHFTLLIALATDAQIDSAKRILAIGAKALLPFAPSPARLGPQWQEKASEWADALLRADELDSTTAEVLASLVYRSAAAREKLVQWLGEENKSHVECTAPALRALLEVHAAVGETVTLSESVAGQLAASVVDATGDTEVSSALIESIVLLAGQSAAAREAVAAAIARAQRAAEPVLALVLTLVAALAKVDKLAFAQQLGEVVSKVLQALVSELTAQEALPPQTLALVSQLSKLLAGFNGALTIKSFVVEPVLSAVAARRLREAEVVELAVGLVQLDALDQTQVTRLLNETFASPLFPKSSEQAGLALEVKQSIVQLVTALGGASVGGAVSAGVVDRMIPFYAGTLSITDQALLALFRAVEAASGRSIAAIVARWTPTAEVSESSRAATLALCDLALVRRAWQRAFASTATAATLDSGAVTYDPAFLLGLVYQAVALDELKPGDWMRLAENGTLSLPLAALASSDRRTRQLARATLAATEAKLATAAFKEAPELLLVVNHARLSIYADEAEPLPALIALFLAEALLSVGQAHTTLYTGISKFLLQRAQVDCFDVPMLYALLFSSQEESTHERRWLVSFLSQGLVRSQDWKLLRRRQTVELTATLFEASASDGKLRKAILALLVRASLVETSALDLVKRHALATLITAQRAQDSSERRLMQQIVINLLAASGAGGEKNAPMTVDLLDSIQALVAAGSAQDEPELARVLGALGRLLATKQGAAGLARVAALLSALSPAIERASDQALLAAFYTAVMALGFARHQLGLAEGVKDRELWKRATEAGLRAGDVGLRRELVRVLA